MHQLVYISTCRGEVSPELLRDILRVSRINNERDGVTGLLVSGGTRFLQALEGPERAVIETYGRILQDKRHFACVVLASRDVSARAFGEWSMAFNPGSRASDVTLSQTIHEMTEGLTDHNLKAEFRAFAGLHQRAA